MNLICNKCGNHETEPYDIGDECYLECGGYFAKHDVPVEEKPTLCKMDDVFYDEGREEKDPTGRDQHEAGAKMDDGKVKAGVLADFSKALEAVAIVGTYGANKYTRNGWESVPNAVERYTDAKWRHLLAQSENMYDQESDLMHMAHEAWNALAILELTLRKKPHKENTLTGHVKTLLKGEY